MADRIKLCTMWERESAAGRRYFSGLLGNCTLLLFDAGQQPHPTKPDEIVHEWHLMIAPRDQDRRPAAKADAQETS
jgi:hypothetical protein